MSLSTMNWKRGLLRLWAVAAVLWVGLAFYSNDTVQRVRDAYALEKTLIMLGAFDDLIPQQAAPRAVATPEQIERALRNAHAAGDTAAATQLARAYRYTEAPYGIWPPLFDFAKLAFIPPLLLLALGYVGLWVGRGFRRQG